MLDQQLSRALDEVDVHDIRMEFRSLRSSELSCSKNTGKPWICQKNFHQYFKNTILPSFFATKVFTIQYKCLYE